MSRPRSNLRSRIAILGSGRLGGLLARSLRAGHWPVVGWARNATSARRWKRLGVPSVATPWTRSPSVDWIFLAVPDERIAPLAARLRRAFPEVTLLHCAGALTLEALRPGNMPGPVGSFHPLCAISSSQDANALPGCAVAISASLPALLRQLRAMARALGLQPISVPERNRGAYHAGALFAAPFVLGVLRMAELTWRAAGLSERDVRTALLPLTRSALKGVEARGTVAALTGPVVRGDAQRVRAHLEALPAAVAPHYRALSEWMLSQLTGLDGSARRRVRRALRE